MTKKLLLPQLVIFYIFLNQSLMAFDHSIKVGFIPISPYNIKHYNMKEKINNPHIKKKDISIEFCTMDESTGDTFCEFLDRERNDGPGWGVDKLRINIKGPYKNVAIKIVHIRKTIVNQKNVDITSIKSFYIRDVWCSDVYLYIYDGKKMILKRIMEYRGC